METNETNEIARKHSLSEIACRVISGIFTPLFIPCLAFLLLFSFTYLRILPLRYKLIVLGMVYGFTFLLPSIAIFLWTRGKDASKPTFFRNNLMPYILAAIGYIACVLSMHRLQLPRYLSDSIVAYLICLVFCAPIRFRWDISLHMAGGGMMVGGLLSYSFLLGFNPVWWLCLFLLLAGMLGTARIIIGQHTLSEVFVGFVIGLFCGIAGILFI